MQSQSYALAFFRIKVC